MERPRFARHAGFERTAAACSKTSNLVESTKKVVSEVKRLLEDGETDSFYRRRLFVQDPRSKDTYEIVELQTDRPPEERTSGLFVHPVTFDEAGKLKRTMPGIQIPRDPEAVTRVSIDNLRGIHPTAMKRLAKQLRRARKIH